MVGGKASILKQVRPVLEVLGKKIFLARPLGAGHAVKALNNCIAAAGTIAAFEAVIVGRAFGLDPALMTDIFNHSAGRNSTTENKIRQHVLSGAFGSGFSLSLMAKDVSSAAVKKLPAGADHTEMYRYLDGLARR